jgi:hypothetical protein
MSRFKVKVGKDFEIEAFDVDDIEDVVKISKISAEIKGAKIREKLDYSILSFCALALILTAAIGFSLKNFEILKYVCTVCSVPLILALKARYNSTIPP